MAEEAGGPPTTSPGHDANQAPKAEEVTRLNLGCGQNHKPGWTNVDENPHERADVVMRFPPIDADDNSVDEIYAGHVLEHFTYADGQTFLRECHRVLVPGGKIGVVVPDFRAIVGRWLGGERELIDGRWDTSDLNDLCRFFLFSDFQPSPHKWAYDADTLSVAIAEAGFIVLGPIDRYTDPRLARGAWWQCGWEAIKPDLSNGGGG